MSVPLQLKLVEFPTLLGPFTIGVGMWILLFWHLERHIVPSLTYQGEPLPLVRIVLVVLLASSVFVTSLGFVTYIDRMWAFVLFLLSLGRVIEAGAAVYGIRKVWHLLGRIWRHISTRSSTDSGTLSEISDRLISRVKFNAFTNAVSVLSSTFVFLVAHSFSQYHWSTSLKFAAGVYVAITVGTMLLWHIRKTLPLLDEIAAYGVILCVSGAEIYEYQGGRYLGSRYLPEAYRRAVRRFIDLVPVLNNWEVTAVLVGQLSFGIGIGLCLLFILTARRPLDKGRG